MWSPLDSHYLTVAYYWNVTLIDFDTKMMHDACLKHFTHYVFETKICDINDKTNISGNLHEWYLLIIHLIQILKMILWFHRSQKTSTVVSFEWYFLTKWSTRASTLIVSISVLLYYFCITWLIVYLFSISSFDQQKVFLDQKYTLLKSFWSIL